MVDVPLEVKWYTFWFLYWSLHGAWRPGQWALSLISYLINPFPAWLCLDPGMYWKQGNCHHFTHPSGAMIYNPLQPRKNKRKWLPCGLVWRRLLTYIKEQTSLHQTLVNSLSQRCIELHGQRQKQKPHSSFPASLSKLMHVLPHFFRINPHWQKELTDKKNDHENLEANSGSETQDHCSAKGWDNSFPSTNRHNMWISFGHSHCFSSGTHPSVVLLTCRQAPPPPFSPVMPLMNESQLGVSDSTANSHTTTRRFGLTSRCECVCAERRHEWNWSLH